MGSESKAREAEGRTGIYSEAIRARGIIVLVKSRIQCVYCVHFTLGSRGYFFLIDTCQTVSTRFVSY